MWRILTKLEPGQLFLKDGQYRCMAYKQRRKVSDKDGDAWKDSLFSLFDISHESRKKWFQFGTRRISLRNRVETRILKDLEASHRFDEERNKQLGPELSCALLVVSCGGGVKLNNRHEWIRKNSESGDNDLPGRYVDGCYVQGIDASNVLLTHYALDNFVGLTSLQYLNFSNMKYLDDLWLGRLHIHADTLEVLDISDNVNITERGLATLYKLPKLQTLKIDNCPNIRNQQYIATLLEEYNPNLSVIGVTEASNEALIDLENKSYEIQTVESRYLTLGESCEAEAINGSESGEHITDGQSDIHGNDVENVINENKSVSETQPVKEMVNR